MRQKQVMAPDNGSYHIEIKKGESSWCPYYVSRKPIFRIAQPIGGSLYGVESLTLLQAIEEVKTLRKEYPSCDFQIQQNILSRRLTALTERANRQ